MAKTLEEIQASPLWEALGEESRQSIIESWNKGEGGINKHSDMASKPFSTDPSTYSEQTRSQLQSLLNDASLSDDRKKVAAGMLVLREMKPYQRIMAGLGRIFEELHQGGKAKLTGQGQEEAANNAAFGKALDYDTGGRIGGAVGQGMLMAGMPGGAGKTLGSRVLSTGAESAAGMAYEGLRALPPEEEAARTGNMLVAGTMPAAFNTVSALGSKLINTVMDKPWNPDYAALTDLGKKHGVRTSFSDLPGKESWKPWTRGVMERVPVIGSRSWRIAQNKEAERAAMDYAESLLPPGFSFEMPTTEMHNELVTSVRSLYNRRTLARNHLFDKVQSNLTGIPKAVRRADVSNLNEQLFGDRGILMEYPDLLDRLDVPTSTRRLFAKVGKKTQKTVKDANGKTIKIDQPLVVEDLFMLDKAINKLIGANKGDPKKKEALSQLIGLKKSVLSDIDAWADDIRMSSGAQSTQSKAVESVLDSWEKAKNYHKMKIAPIDNTKAIWKMTLDNGAYDPSRAVVDWIKRDAPEIYTSAGSVVKGRAGILDAMDLKGRQILKANIMQRMVQGSVSSGTFSPNTYADLIEKNLGTSLEGLLNNTERAELGGLVKLLRHVEMAGVVAKSKGSEISGFGAGLPGVSAIVGGLVGNATQSGGALGGAATAATVSVVGTLAVNRLLTSDAGRRILTSAWRLPTGSKGMQIALNKAEKFLIGAATKDVVARLNNDAYIEELWNEVEAQDTQEQTLRAQGQ